MSIYKKYISILTEGKTGGEQAGRANLSRIPQTRATRTQARGLGAGPHDAPDAGEGSPEDVKQHQQQTQRSRVSGMPSAQKLSLLRIAAKTATGIKLSRIQRMIRSLEGEGNDKKAMNASTETNMNGYEKLFEMLINEDGRGGQAGESRKTPGWVDSLGQQAHLGRLRAIMRQLRNDPEWQDPSEKARQAGEKGAEKTKETFRKRGKKS